MGMNITEQKLAKYAALAKTANMLIYEYHPKTDTAIRYDFFLDEDDRIVNYMQEIDKRAWLPEEERDKYVQFIRGIDDGRIEVLSMSANGEKMLKSIRKVRMVDEDGEEYIILSMKDITMQRKLERKYQNQAQRDSMTGLYNHATYKTLIENYLKKKTPYEACGLLVIDVDYFKGVNDSYGHLFGDKVLTVFADMLIKHFGDIGIVARIGGDEFSVLLKNINNTRLISALSNFIREIRTVTFKENDYMPTCSIGACYIAENVACSNYEQVIGNADWALYEAKKQGRNRYVFCDNMHRFEEKKQENQHELEEIDARYFQNDIVATCFEVFEKSCCLTEAMNLMLKIIGMRFQLDRITIIHTDIENMKTERMYQWLADGIPTALIKSSGFEKDDFITLFRGYDEYDSVVLNYDHMEQYSPDAAALLMQGDAKTVLYIAMYDDGKYIGAVSFTTCHDKRFWSKDKRRELSEITKLFCLYMKKYAGVNVASCGYMSVAEVDNITGLVSFDKFKQSVERIIVSAQGSGYVMVYSDFENFTEYNKVYGYASGDRLLREFADYIISTFKRAEETHFARIVADQFVLFMPYDITQPDIVEKVSALNEAFSAAQYITHDQIKVRVRTGIYCITDQCVGVSMAIDAANTARKQIKSSDSICAAMYHES